MEKEEKATCMKGALSTHTSIPHMVGEREREKETKKYKEQASSCA
jgi:hypothetical protein